MTMIQRVYLLKSSYQPILNVYALFICKYLRVVTSLILISKASPALDIGFNTKKLINLNDLNSENREEAVSWGVFSRVI